MRNVLKEFVFPADVRALPPADDRTSLIFQIVSNLFNEITFYIFNILIGENTVTNSFYIFFSGRKHTIQTQRRYPSRSAAMLPSMSSCSSMAQERYSATPSSALTQTSQSSSSTSKTAANFGTI